MKAGELGMKRFAVCSSCPVGVAAFEAALEGVTGSLGSKKTATPSQLARGHFSVLGSRLRFSRFAVLTEVDLVVSTSALPELAHEATFFHITYRQLGAPRQCCARLFSATAEGGVPPDWLSRMRFGGGLQTAVHELRI